MFGREAELAEVEAALASARQRLAGLVIEGDPGIGKTTVWQRGIAHAAGAGYRVLSCRAVPAEAKLSFSALGDLLAPIESAAFGSLPDPQRRALDAALLRADVDGPAPNPRAIGTAIVSLLSALAASAPVAIAIDDLQWLDSPSERALEFALRRLDSRAVAVLATRRLGAGRNRGGLFVNGGGERVRPLRLGPLSLAALYRIIEAQLALKLPRPLLVRIERACGGNAFFALEIARALRERGLPAAGDALPISEDLHGLVAQRLRKLPRRTRAALLRASALAQPTLAAVDAAALVSAEEAGLVRIGAEGRIGFVHPLFAVGIYAAESRERRRQLHAELAEVAADLEERARHLTLAGAHDAEDERVAGLLHEAAEHALRRGAIEIAADLAEQSARLTPAAAAPIRAQRQLRAARHFLAAGDPAHASALCEAVIGAAPPDPVRAEALHRLSEVAIAERPESAIALLEQALACVGNDIARAAQLECLLGGVLAQRLELVPSYRHLTRAVELAEQTRDAGLLAQALAMRAASSLWCGEGIDELALERALVLEDPDREVPFQMSTLLNVACAYEYLTKFDTARGHLLRLRQRVIARGEEGELPRVLGHLAACTGMSGDLAGAEREASDAEQAAAMTGSEILRAFALVVRANMRAMRGDGPGARTDARDALALSERIGWTYGKANGRWALGMLALAEGEPEAALSWLGPVASVIEHLRIYEWPIAMSLPDAIEALVVVGDRERAARLAQALGDWGRRFDRPWALATSARGEALLAAADGELDRALAAAEQALAAHERLPMPFERGRTLLVLGQVQRRRGERRAARQTLEQARGLFAQIGAVPWAERAAAELARIGVRRASGELTESEQRVAELAAQGLKNPEIAARLFMSRRTVEANLARAYRKLGIGSRAELGATMARRGRVPQ